MQAIIKSPAAMPAGSASVRLPLATSANPPIFGTPQANCWISFYRKVQSITELSQGWQDCGGGLATGAINRRNRSLTRLDVFLVADAVGSGLLGRALRGPVPGKRETHYTIVMEAFGCRVLQ
jgi:hypothetical protein